ncbi:hypothetical protein QPK87_20505 [Kamptonema cortianum]|jgi:DNA-directed RNA polymerase subunit RPC12/RpoP|nr:hypothetical protein [Kamptonema cortianum]
MNQSIAFAHLEMLFSARARNPRERAARCPQCKTKALFRFDGVQRWSEAVARAAGLPRVTYLYTCEHCGTTVSENALDNEN